MNEIVSMLDNFQKLPPKKQLEFMEHYKALKNEFKVLNEENTILKEGLQEVRGVSQ